MTLWKVKIFKKFLENFFHEIRNLTESANLEGERQGKHGDEAIAQAQIWTQDNLARPLNIPKLAEQFGMTTRTFNRRFKAATGQTPIDYLTHVRMTFACDLLKNTDLSILEVAGFSGFKDATWFSSRFKYWSGDTPKAYRQTVRAKLFD